MNPAIALFVFELAGAPVGLVELRAEGAAYRYTSRQFYARGKVATQSAELSPDAGATPEGLWLWRKPPAGCVRGVDELTGGKGELCADEVGEASVKGRMLGEPFTAAYDGGELAELKLGQARFYRVKSAKGFEPGDPFEQGFAIDGAAGALVLLREGGGRSAAAPGAARVERPADAASCLDLARAYAAKRGKSATLVFGLVEDGGRAWPHAWVRVDGREVDPSREAQPTARTHLALGDGPHAAAAYLDLLSGKAKVARIAR